MGGGEIQLHKYGAQNIYLNGNPQITYFKSVYKRHSNFSMETIRMDFETSNSLTFTQSSVDNILSYTISEMVTLSIKYIFHLIFRIYILVMIQIQIFLMSFNGFLILVVN